MAAADSAPLAGSGGPATAAAGAARLTHDDGCLVDVGHEIQPMRSMFVSNNCCRGVTCRTGALDSLLYNTESSCRHFFSRTLEMQIQQTFFSTFSSFLLVKVTVEVMRGKRKSSLPASVTCSPPLAL